MSAEAFDRLAEECEKQHEPLDLALISRGLITQERLYELLATTLNLPYVDISNHLFEPGLLD